MCGIVGGVGELPKNVLLEMTAAIHHRGPDNQDVYTDGKIHLGHTRLSVIDLSAESNQPLWDSTGSACIVFNGEIYNFEELRANLVKLGVQFHSSGDAEVLLNYYLVKGADGLSDINGIFSFAIWDARRDELFLARDKYGVKPIYYTKNDKGFYFSSEIKSLLMAPGFSRELNKQALLRTLVFLWSPGEETLFASVRKVKPGHYMRISHGTITEDASYWQWPKYSPDEVSSEDTHSKSVISSLKSSVEDQMVSDVEVGAFLSGGLDSSLIVSLAKGVKENIECFTIDTGSSDEIENDLPYAKYASEALNVNLNILSIKPSIVDILPKVIYHMDELQADPAAINVMLISRLAREKGIKVLLSGAGGDDLFTGYRRHYALGLEKYWKWSPLFVRKSLKKASSLLPESNLLGRRVSKAFRYADCNDSYRLLSYFFWLDPKVAVDLFVDGADLEDSFQFMMDDISSQRINDPLERMLYIERKYFLIDHNFNYTDKMSMAEGVEVRVPFLDDRVASAASTVPSALKQKGKTGKHILKKAAEKYLPSKLIYRPKSGFGAPLRDWLKNDLSSMVDELLCAERVAQRGIFKPAKVAELIEADRQGKDDYSYSIYALLCFELWCQKFLDS